MEREISKLCSEFLAAAEWIEELELVTGVQMQRRKPGPKPKGAGETAN